MENYTSASVCKWGLHESVELPRNHPYIYLVMFAYTKSYFFGSWLIISLNFYYINIFVSIFSSNF